MMKQCTRCQHNNPEHRDNCLECGQYLTNEEDLLRVARFKWWFVLIVVFCLVMFFVLPR